MDTDMSIRVIESKNESEIMHAISISLHEGKCCFSYKDNNKYGAIILSHPKTSFGTEKTSDFPKYERPSKPGKMSKDESFWSKVLTGTKVQVRDKDCDRWQDAYFYEYIKDSEFPFGITFKNSSFNIIGCDEYFKQCKLYKDVY